MTLQKILNFPGKFQGLPFDLVCQSLRVTEIRPTGMPGACLLKIKLFVDPRATLFWRCYSVIVKETIPIFSFAI